MDLGIFTLTVLGQTQVVQIDNDELGLDQFLPLEIQKRLYDCTLVAFDSTGHFVRPERIPRNGDHIVVTDDEEKVKTVREYRDNIVKMVVNKFGEILPSAKAKETRQDLLEKGYKLWDLRLEDALKLIHEV